MLSLIKRLMFVWISFAISGPVLNNQQGLSEVNISATSMEEQALTQKQALGKKLFFDTNLSTPVGQACADCHSPESGFGNPNAEYPVSQGVHKDRFGNRNDLPAAYAAFSPEFHYDANEGLYVGGQFWDGRAADLIEQAKGPFLNALEMANPDEKTVVEKVRKSEYADLFREVFGAAAFKDPSQTYDMIAEAIAAYEKSRELNQFNSKYDLYLAGKVALTEQELRGLKLFEDEQKGNCAECHPSKPGDDGTPPLFTDFTYDNLGAPKNPENPFYYLPKELNPDGVYFIDLGLGGELNKPSENGKFKVPSLRNVAKTAPYLHNGIFKNLRQVVVFYNTRDVGPWPPPEVRANVNRDELGDLGLTEQEIDDIVAFMLTLTDGYNPKNN
ncbi:MAG: cytochrome-c peroxidase [Planctomycetota bacterium]